MQSNPQYSSLTEMGCSTILSEAAIKKLNTQDLSALLDWIEEHNQEEEKWKQWLIDNKDKPAQQKSEEQGKPGQSIEHLINKQFAASLQQKGFSKNVSQKALLFTNNVNVQSAQKWAEQHKYDVDYQEQLFLEGQAFKQSKLSPEEARKKLDELTKKARENREKKEKEDSHERQKNRVKYGKELTEAKRKAEQASMRRQVELDKIQKQKDQQYKTNLLNQMRRERNEKLGIKQQQAQPEKSSGKAEIKLTKIEQVEVQCEQVRVGMHAYPQKGKTFFETALKYVKNVLVNNGEQKYRRINMENKNFQDRIADVFGGVEVLKVVGYEEDGGFLYLKDLDLAELELCYEVIKKNSFYF